MEEMNIEIDNHGITHAHAKCHECGWNKSMNIEKDNSLKDLKISIENHIMEISHQVSMETAVITTYILNKDNE